MDVSESDPAIRSTFKDIFKYPTLANTVNLQIGKILVLELKSILLDLLIKIAHSRKDIPTLSLE
jgi:hypothetical protein